MGGTSINANMEFICVNVAPALMVPHTAPVLIGERFSGCSVQNSYFRLHIVHEKVILVTNPIPTLFSLEGYSLPKVHILACSVCKGKAQYARSTILFPGIICWLRSYSFTFGSFSIVSL